MPLARRPLGRTFAARRAGRVRLATGSDITPRDAEVARDDVDVGCGATPGGGLPFHVYSDRSVICLLVVLGYMLIYVVSVNAKFSFP